MGTKCKGTKEVLTSDRLLVAQKNFTPSFVEAVKKYILSPFTSDQGLSM